MKRVRIVSYAINGRGMGHLVRQLAILRMARQLCALLDVKLEPWILTSSEADTLARREGIPALKMPSKAMLRDSGMEPHRYLAVARGWVLNAIAGLQPDVLVVDTFPGGSFAELVPVLDIVPRKVLVARRVRVEASSHSAYAPLVPLYDDVIVPDDRGVGPILIREAAELWSRSRAREALGIADGARAVYVTRGGGGDLDAARELPTLVRSLRDRGWHVVVGAGPLYQGPEVRGAGITWLDRYTPCELLAGVDAAVSAAGYNTFHELMQAGVSTVFLPQPRISDDQERRARSAVEVGAGRVARTLSEVPDLLQDLCDAAGSDAAGADAARSLVPGGGARAAAARVLCQVLPEADVAMALASLTDDLLRVTARLGHGAPRKKALHLVRMLSGPSPSARARHRITLLKLRDEGVSIEIPDEVHDAGPAERVDRFLGLCDELEISLDTAVAVVGALQRTFPLATPDALVGAVASLLPVWAGYDDWMGALSLLRAVPTQRTMQIAAFAELVVSWLDTEDDLFEAVAHFSRLEGHGARSVPEVLHLLLREATP